MNLHTIPIQKFRARDLTQAMWNRHHNDINLNNPYGELSRVWVENGQVLGNWILEGGEFEYTIHVFEFDNPHDREEIQRDPSRYTSPGWSLYAEHIIGSNPPAYFGDDELRTVLVDNA